MAISIQVCNFALSEVRAPPITSIDDPCIEARECGRFYPMCLQSLLEVHEWSYAAAIVTLAQLAINERASEWTYAYQLPNDVGIVRRIFGSTFLPVSGIYYPHGMSCLLGNDYEVENGILYSGQSTVTLEYGRNTLEEAQMPMVFRKALALDLASYLAYALLQDSRLKGELIQHAEVEKQRAMAQDMNRQPQPQRRWPMAFGIPFGLEPTVKTVATAAPAVTTPDAPPSFDFSLAGNSQYLPLLIGMGF